MLGGEHEDIGGGIVIGKRRFVDLADWSVGVFILVSSMRTAMLNFLTMLLPVMGLQR